MEKTVNMNKWKDRQELKMYTAYDLQAILDIPYASALALTKKHGIRIGKSYRLSRAKLGEVLGVRV